MKMVLLYYECMVRAHAQDYTERRFDSVCFEQVGTEFKHQIISIACKNHYSNWAYIMVKDGRIQLITETKIQ